MSLFPFDGVLGFPGAGDSSRASCVRELLSFSLVYFIIFTSEKDKEGNFRRNEFYNS